MTTHEIRTPLTPAEVMERARAFFLRGGTPYACLDRAGDGWMRLHMEVGEIVIGAMPGEWGTRVRGSASRGAPLLARFLATLAPPLEVRQTVRRHGARLETGARVDAIGSARPAAPREGRAP